MLIDIVVDREYNISIECNKDNLLVYHSNVNRWNKSVRDRYIADFKKMRSLHSSKPVYTYAYVSNTKTIKFAKMLGFVESHTTNNILYMKHKEID